MQQGVHAHEWRKYGFGGPPEPWDGGAQRDLDRLATSYYLDILETHSDLLDGKLEAEIRHQVEELFLLIGRNER